jgi:hypothetical protein
MEHMKASERELVHRTPNPECPGCIAMRLHTPEEFKQFHPLAGHGFSIETGWTGGIR